MICFIFWFATSIKLKVFSVLTGIHSSPQQNKKLAEKTVHLLDNVGSSLLATKTVGEKPTVMKTKNLALVLDRQLPDKMGGKTLGEGDSAVSLPSSDTLFGDTASNLPAVDSQVAV